MSLTAKSNGGTFELPPDGTHPARCYRMIDKGTSYDQKWEKHQHKVLVSWALLGDEKMTDGRPFTVHRNYTVSLHEKSVLRRDLKAWRGRDFTAEELGGFVLTAIVGAPCLLTIVHNKDGDRTFANIAGIMACPKGMKVPELTEPTLVFDLDQPDWDVFDGLSEGIQEAIKRSEEYQKYADKPGVPQSRPAAPVADSVEKTFVAPKRAEDVPGIAAAAEIAGAGEKSIDELVEEFEDDSAIPF